jgi:hypothetical protein
MNPRHGNFRGLSAVLLLGFAGPAHGIDEVPSPAPERERVAIDSSVDVSSFRTWSFDINGTFAPFGAGLSESGLRLRLTGSTSSARYLAAEFPRDYAYSRTHEVDVLAGYGAVGERLSLLALGGGVLGQTEDTGAHTRNERFGFKGVLSFYARPTDLTMAYGSYRFSSLDNAYHLQTKLGVQAPWGMYVGPELVFSGSDVYAQTRFGAHVSAIKLGPMQVGFSAGLARDRKSGDGGYFGLSLYGAF